MALTDYEELAARSFDEHHDPELRAAVQVCADALAQIDDPRGPLISYEYALESTPDHRRALELRRAMHAHATEHAVALIGEGAAPLLKQPRTMTCEWRSGMLYALSLDARYVAKKARMSCGDLVRIVLKAPVAKHLRRLRVRVRSEDDVTSITTMLAKQKHPLPLEELEIGRQVWPYRISAVTSSASTHANLLDKYPNLFYLALKDAIIPIVARNLTIADVLMADPPAQRWCRILVGRALFSHDDALREAALQRIATFGETARVYAFVLGVLLQPPVIAPVLPLIAALRALGTSRETNLVLAKVSSRTRQYDAATRKAAGAAAFAIRPPSP